MSQPPMAPRARPGRPSKLPQGIKEINLDDAVDSFIASFSHRVSKSTVKTKRGVTTVMIEQLGPKFKVWQLDRDIFTQLWTVLIVGSSDEERRQRLAAGRKIRRGRTTRQSQDAMAVALRQFAKFCHQRDWLEGRETLPQEVVVGHQDMLNGAPLREKLRLTPARWDYVLELAGKRHPRLRMSLAICLYMTRRISEAASLTWGDFDWDERVIKFNNHKGGRLHIMPFRDEFIAELLWYRNWWIENYGPPQPHQYVVPVKLQPHEMRGAGAHVLYRKGRNAWPLNPDRKVTPQALAREHVLLLDELGIDRKKFVAGTHTWRRSGATQLARDHGMGATQYALAHKSIVTSQTYTGNLDGQENLWAAWQPGTMPPAGGDIRAIPKTRDEVVVMDDHLAEVVELRPRRKVS